MSSSETLQGYIETTYDSLLVFEACRRGLLPRVRRRLQEKERRLIRSGTIICFNEKESGIKRWTDGLVWSPSRILGNFLVYRELDKRTTHEENSREYSHRQGSGETEYLDHFDWQRERALVGSLTDRYRFKRDGLVKKSISLVIDGVQHHLISYYTKDDVLANRLHRPSMIRELMSLKLSKTLLQQQHFRIPLDLDSEYSKLNPLKTDFNPSKRKLTQRVKENNECTIATLQRKRGHTPNNLPSSAGNQVTNATGHYDSGTQNLLCNQHATQVCRAQHISCAPSDQPMVDHKASLDYHNISFATIPQNNCIDPHQSTYHDYIDRFFNKPQYRN